MSHIDATAFRFKLRGETVEQLADRIAMWNRIQASSDHASKVRAKLLALTHAELSRRAASAHTIKVSDIVTPRLGDGTPVEMVITHVITGGQ